MTFVLLTALSGCRTAELLNEESSDVHCYHATMEPATKTQLGDLSHEGYQILWSQGDRIALSHGNEAAQSEYITSDGGSTSATFRFMSEKAGNILPLSGSTVTALYPVDYYSHVNEAHVIKLPETQPYVPDNVSSGTMPMLATSSDTELHFKNICGIIRLRLNSLTPNTRIVSIKLGTCRNLSGPIVSYISDSDMSWNLGTYPDGKFGNIVSLECPDVELAPEPKDFHIVVPPAVYPSMYIQLELCGDISENRIYCLKEGITVNRSEIAVIELDLAKFRSIGTEDIVKGENGTALTGVRYLFSGKEGLVDIFKEGGSGSIDIESILEKTWGDSTGTEGIAWNATFSTDGGETWTGDAPEMFSHITRSSDGTSGNTTLDYSVKPCSGRRQCLVRLTQKGSGHELTFKFMQYSNVMLLTYDTTVEDKMLTLCQTRKGLLDYVVFDDGTEDDSFNDIVTTFLNVTHTFKTPGRHRVRLIPNDDAESFAELFKVPSLDYAKHYCLTGADLSHADLSKIKDLSEMFYGCRQLENCIFPETVLDSLRDIGGLFYNCSDIRELDLSSFNTENVTDMAGLFYGCTSLQNLDISSFSTGNARDMSDMFSRCEKLTELDLRHFDTGNVTDMSSMFFDCISLSALDISSFRTDKVTGMGSMFRYCMSLSEIDVSRFNTTHVTGMSAMFESCSKVESLDVSGFDTSECLYMSSMFNDCSKLESLDVSRFNTEKVTNMNSMFHRCTSLAQIDVSNFHTPNVKDMAFMFDSTPVEKLDVSRFDFSSVTNTREMFVYCRNLKSLEIKDFKAPNLISAYNMFTSCGLEELSITDFECGQGCNLSNMFRDCIKLSALTLKDFDASNADDLSYMFCSCISLTAPDFSTFRTANVKKMNHMFYGCSNLSSLDLSGFRTANATDMFGMFCGTGITSLDLSSFDTRKVTDMTRMFMSCDKLEVLDISSFRTPALVSASDMFSGCKAIKALDIGGFNTENVTEMDYMFDGCRSVEELDVSNFSGKSLKHAGHMFRNCVKLKKIDLSNLSLASIESGSGYGYGISRMFSGCLSLQELHMDLREIGQNDFIYGNMFYNVPDSGILYLKDGTADERITSQLPSGWTVSAF